MKSFNVLSCCLILFITCYTVHGQRATCTMVKNGQPSINAGTLTLTQHGSKLTIAGSITGLTQGLHGFHVHDAPISGADCKSAKGHFNPANQNHGGPTDSTRHVGDLGNILAGSNGIANVNVQDSHAALLGAKAIVGRSIVVHEGQDDLGKGGHPDSLTTGNAGGRYACCTIMLQAARRDSIPQRGFAGGYRRRARWGTKY